MQHVDCRAIKDRYGHAIGDGANINRGSSECIGLRRCILHTYGFRRIRVHVSMGNRYRRNEYHYRTSRCNYYGYAFNDHNVLGAPPTSVSMFRIYGGSHNCDQHFGASRKSSGFRAGPMECLRIFDRRHKPGHSNLRGILRLVNAKHRYTDGHQQLEREFVSFKLGRLERMPCSG